MRIAGRGQAGASRPDELGRRGTALATVGLAAVLALLAGTCTWVAVDASRTSARATHQLAIASAQESVLEAALAEHTAQLSYLECPLAFDPVSCSAQERRSYEEASRRLEVALQEVEATGDAADRSGAAYLRLIESRYDVAVQRQFAALDRGLDVEARRLQRETAAPEIDQVLQIARAAAQTHEARAAAGIGRLGGRTRRSAELIPVVFGVAFLLLGGCWAVLVSLQRRLHRQTRALSREKTLVDGVISAIPHLVYWKDAQGGYQGMNRAFVRQRAEEPDMDGLLEVLAGLERGVTHTGEPVLDQHVKVTGSDGNQRQLLVSVIPRFGVEGAIEGVIGVGTDVTHIRDLERQLAQAQRLESIGQLASGIAHEINTPVQFLSDNTRFVTESVQETLAALRAITSLLEQEAPDPAALRSALEPVDLEYLEEELPEALADSRAGLKRVAEIVRAMKEFAHPGDSRREADLNAAIDATVKVSRGEWRDVAEVDLDLDPDLGPISCYEGEVKQVLLNMVVNAAQAIAEGCAKGAAGPGHIRITSHRAEDEVRITVADDGPGMPEEVRRRVFDPFFTTKEVGKGTGQGLALAHATIVRKHGGTIDVVSSPGEGTTFEITLPVAPGDVVQAEGGAAKTLPADQ